MLKVVRRIIDSLEFVAFYAKEVTLSNIRVAYDVLTPPLFADPGMVEYQLAEDLTDRQVMMLANLITMTPGTLSLDVTPDRRILHIHVMYLPEKPEDLLKTFKQDYERRIRHVF